MRHLEEGQLCAYLDGALRPPERERVQEHLATCARCAQTASRLQARGARVRTWLNSIEAQSTRVPVAPEAARRRLDTYLAQKRKGSNIMRQNLFARRYRPAWVAAALVVAFALSFTLAPVRAWANNLLSLFRVQKIEFVQVDPSSFPDEEALERAMRSLEGVMEEQLTIEAEGESQVVTLDAARSSAGFRVRAPTVLEGDPRVTLKPGLHAAMQVDLARARVLLAELGYGNVDLPDSLNGAEISIGFEPMVDMVYGSCSRESGEQGTTLPEECVEFSQMPTPQVSAPPDLDLDRLGQAYLQLLGMSADEAARFSQRVDWTTTLVVPLPPSANLGYRDVPVDGVTGTLIRPPEHSRYAQEYLLTWVKDGVVYALHGTGEVEQALEIANSLQ